MDSQIAASKCFSEWLGSLWDTLRIGFSLPLSEVTGSLDEPVDSMQEFDGWLHGDPAVTKNPASRYGDRSHGYIPGNGQGDLEIGHRDD